MKNPSFSVAALSILEQFADAVEAADSEGNCDVELNGGVLTITHESGPQIVISRHEPSQQIWLASPRSGGLHFSPDAEFKHWRLSDGRTLTQVLEGDLAALAGLRLGSEVA